MRFDANTWDLFPFSQYQSGDYKHVILEKIHKAEQDIESIIYQSDAPTFSNTIIRLENNSLIYNRYVEVFFNLNSASTDDIIQKDAHEIAEKLSDFSNSILLNERLFERIEKVYMDEMSGHSTLDTESLRLLKDTFESFVRNGARLAEDQKEKIKEIDAELSKCTLTFSDHVLAETNQQFLHLHDIEDLKGLNSTYIQMYRQIADTKNLEGYVITLQFPSYVPFMKYCENRALREQLYHMYMTRGARKNEHDNIDIIKKIVALRHERAQILGFKSHADFVLQKRMAGSVEKVNIFLHDLLEKALPYAQRDIDQLKSIAHKYHIEEVAAYDHAFLAEKLKEELFDFSDEDLKPYLSLESCLQAVFDLSHKMYGLVFNKLTDVETYHPDADVYEVVENGQFKAILYTDFYARDNKKPGAWMTVYKNQRMEGQINVRPHISIVCNYTPPSADRPTLLTFDDFTTLFHEFGHALHGMLANTTYESMSGTNVYWDFVELPSQFMENFCYNKEFLRQWARHYQTNEVIPEELIDKIVASSQFMEAYQTVRQLSFGILDIAYYSQGCDDGDLVAFERQTIAQTQLYPWYKDAALSPSFSHIFGGGYDAGYYSYKWAEVLDADAYAYLKSHDFDQEVVEKFKNLLSKGGTEDPMELYKSFRGQEPTADALLERAGI